MTVRAEDFIKAQIIGEHDPDTDAMRAIVDRYVGIYKRHELSTFKNSVAVMIAKAREEVRQAAKRGLL